MAKARKKVKDAKREARRRLRRRRRRAARGQGQTGARKAAKAETRKPQRFAVSHHREEDFDAGLRTYSAYRDLGLAPATDGMVQAHVIRMTQPFEAEEVSTPHYHDVDFQMIYVLKGWFKTEFEGEGVHTFTPARAGSSRRRSSTPCSAIPTTASCWRSCCRPISKR